MRVLLTADIHLSDKPRDEYRWGFMRRFIKMVADRKPDKVIIVGDITEEKDQHRSRLVNQVVNHIAELAKITEVIVVEGNHDYSEEGSAFFEFVSRIPNVRWIAKPTMLHKPRWLLLPHTNDWKKKWKGLEFSECKGVICHQTFNSANVGFSRATDGIPLDAIPTHLPVWAGDVHVPQKVSPNITYIGAPYTVDFGDDYASRVLQWEDGKVTSISTAKYPQKRLATLQGFNDLAGVEFNEGDLVRVVVETDTLENWQELRGKIALYMQERLWTPWSIEPKMIRKATRQRLKLKTSQSDEQVVEAHAQRVGLTPQVEKTGKLLL